jgi:hypothetical protein
MFQKQKAPLLPYCSLRLLIDLSFFYNKNADATNKTIKKLSVLFVTLHGFGNQLSDLIRKSWINNRVTIPQ